MPSLQPASQEGQGWVHLQGSLQFWDGSAHEVQACWPSYRGGRVFSHFLGGSEGGLAKDHTFSKYFAKNAKYAKNWLVGWSVGWLAGWSEPKKQEKLKR